MPTSRDTVIGACLVITSAFVFSVSGVLTKAIVADVWTIACWRGLIGGVLIAAYVAVTERQPDKFRLGWRGWLLASVGAASSLVFILAFKMTYIANVAIIYATAPFMAAALAWIVMRESCDRRTLVGAGLSMVGVGIVVSGGLGRDTFAGDGVAVLMTFGNALYMVLIRRFTGISAVWAGGVSALQLFALSWFFTEPLSVAQRDIPLLIIFAVAFAVANVLWTEGTKRISAAESGLFGTAEIPFAVLLAWLVLADIPPIASFVGGGIIMAVVLVLAFADIRKHRGSSLKIR